MVFLYRCALRDSALVSGRICRAKCSYKMTSAKFEWELFKRKREKAMSPNMFYSWDHTHHKWHMEELICLQRLKEQENCLCEGVVPVQSQFTHLSRTLINHDWWRPHQWADLNHLHCPPFHHRHCCQPHQILRPHLRYRLPQGIEAWLETELLHWYFGMVLGHYGLRDRS